MEPADDHRQVSGAEPTAEVERARELVRLHANQPHESRPGGRDLPDRGLDVDDRVAFVVGVDLDVDVGTKHVVLRTAI